MHVLSHDFPAQLGSRPLVVAANSGEHAGDGHRFDSLGLQILKKGPGGRLIEGGQLLTIVLKATANDGGPYGDFFQILRPVHHGGDAHRGGGAQAQHADGGQMLALHDGIGALGGAQHGLADLLPVHARLLQHRPYGGQNAVIGVRRGVPLDAGHHLSLFVQKDGVGIGAAHVDSQLIHQALPPLQRSSSGM